MILIIAESITIENVVTEGASVVVSKYGFPDMIDTKVVVGLSMEDRVVEENGAVVIGLVVIGLVVIGLVVFIVVVVLFF